MIIDDLIKRQRLNAELIAINDIQQELVDLTYDAVVTAMGQCKERNAKPEIYWAMLMATFIGLLTSQARGVGIGRDEFLATVARLYDLSAKVNEPTGVQH